MSPDKWFRSVIRCSVIAVTLLMLTPVASASWKEKVLYSFTGGNDGAVPAGGVVFDNAGNLYGATTYTSSCPTTFDCGTVYELSPPRQKDGDWTENTLHVFEGHDKNDGGSPEGGIILDAAGNLYGTTAYGGSGPCTLFGTAVGCGAVYEMSPPATKGGSWTETILYNFRGGNDGQFPIGNLTFDGTGNLYGATYFGGGSGSCDAPNYQHCGTVFRLSPPKTKSGKWTEQKLYSFKGGTDGANPNGGLVLDRKSAIYGTTYSGGTQNCTYQGYVGCGTAFKLDLPSKKGGAWSEKQLHVFTAGSDGANPAGALIFDAKGSLYGTAQGGSASGGGIVFRLMSSNGGHWKKATLHWFNNSGPGAPLAGLLLDSVGNFYGTTDGGDSEPGGTVFQLRPPGRNGEVWSIDLLYGFKGSPDGAYPNASLVLGKSGNLYSTTQLGGAGQSCQGGCGTVFEVSPYKGSFLRQGLD